MLRIRIQSEDPGRESGGQPGQPRPPPSAFQDGGLPIYDVSSDPRRHSTEGTAELPGLASRGGGRRGSRES